MVRELVVLGTSSHLPTRTRNHNGYLLLWDGEGYLFDPGEGTQRQMTFAGVSASKITHICLTHVHGDHSYGLPGVISRLAADGVEHDVQLHYPSSGEEFVRALVSVATPPPNLHLVPHDAAGEVAENLRVAPLRHRVEAFGYRLTEPDGRTMLPDKLAEAGILGSDIARLRREGSLGGVRLDDVSVPRAGQSFAFIMDTAPCAGAEELADGVDMLVSECTFADEDADLARDYLHLTAGQAGELARASRARHLVLTHFSSRYPNTDQLVAQAQARAPETIVAAADDFDRFPMPARRRR
ncbi:RNAse Z [Paramicrobacterium humi]|uniref:Ribonuclease Z n=1 Tax=Paramicrobacterium humi TaxID=640635 RepID=A0A1H4JWW9_9MICO|nr:ribonuclease Z [Microbacterium humi]SEB50800.1 RNAse Z [Microbacterium humi]